MATTHYDTVSPSPVVGFNESDQGYGNRRHRLAEVRLQQGISLRKIARTMGMTTDQARRQENGDVDLSLDDLFKWQSALDVPIGELLVEPDQELTSPIQDRAKMLRLMKTAVTLKERSSTPPVQRMATMLVEQLVDLMPELEEVSAWPRVGRRRPANEVGRILEQQITEDMFHSADYD